jgi:hypothetical protein
MYRRSSAFIGVQGGNEKAPPKTGCVKTLAVLGSE